MPTTRDTSPTKAPPASAAGLSNAANIGIASDAIVGILSAAQHASTAVTGTLRGHGSSG
jgi:hypothetical protein